MGLPLVSFVIPVRNGERDIARCLRAILALQYPPEHREILVMDNGSTDRTTQEVAALGCDYHVLPHVHVSTLRNRGVALARGDYVAFVDADVELTPAWLHRGLAVFQEPRVVASGCFPRVPPAATWVQRAWDVHQRGTYGDKTVWPVAWLPAMNLLVRRAVFVEAGGFDEQLVTTEDVDLCYRLGQHGVILCNPAMDAVHWGEAPDVRTFWRKEVWRSIGNLRGVWTHGLRWDELPSVGYPLYMLGSGLLTLIAGGLDVWQGQVRWLPLSLAGLSFPALLLALRAVRAARHPAVLPQLFVLYLLYGLARAYAVVKP